MITLGTEWGRDLVHADIWTRLWAARAECFPLVVADDVRFPNEVAGRSLAHPRPRAARSGGSTAPA
jgi:hypothetical protein